MTEKIIGNPKLPPSINNIRFISIALAVYMAWTAATYAFEGRVDLLQRIDPVARLIYTAVANIAIGTVLALIALRYLVDASFLKPESLGFAMSRLRNIAVIVGAFAGGLALFMLQNPVSLEPMVILNVFLQVLPVSIAEVLVCWALIGTSFKTLVRSKGKIKSMIIGAVAASVLFGLYHYAHSAPFNQTSMVLFLMLPSIATALTYLLTRNIYAAIIIQNFLGMVGVIGNIHNLEPFRQPMAPVYAMAAVSVAALLTAIYMILRVSMKKIKT